MTVYLREQPLGIGNSLKIRRSEWGLSAWLAFAWGATLVLDPAHTLMQAPFAVLHRWASKPIFMGFDTDLVVGFGCLTVGGARLLVLIVNGRWWRCSHARMMLAGLSCFFWAAFALGFYKVGVGSPGAIGYSIFLLLDLHTVNEAAQDARSAEDRRRALTS